MDTQEYLEIITRCVDFLTHFSDEAVTENRFCNIWFSFDCYSGPAPFLPDSPDTRAGFLIGVVGNCLQVREIPFRWWDVLDKGLLVYCFNGGMSSHRS